MEEERMFRSRLVYFSIVSRFLDECGDTFSESQKARIRNYLLRGEYPNVFSKDMIREIMDQLSLIPDQYNIYLTFLDEITSHFDVNGKNIVEVGGGAFPRLAKRLHLKQKEGTITVYDPRLSPLEKSNERFILKKEPFTRHTPTEDVDLLVGLMPCEAISHMVDQVVEHKKDFIIWFCEGGPHGDYFDFYEDEDEWFHAMLSILKSGVKRNNMGKVMVKRYPDFSQYPIVYNSKEE